MCTTRCDKMITHGPGSRKQRDSPAPPPQPQGSPRAAPAPGTRPTSRRQTPGRRSSSAQRILSCSRRFAGDLSIDSGRDCSGATVLEGGEIRRKLICLFESSKPPLVFSIVVSQSSGSLCILCFMYDLFKPGFRVLE